MKPYELDGKIHLLYFTAEEWREARYGQTSLPRYSDLLKKVGDPSIVKLHNKHFYVGSWVLFHKTGVMQILSIKRVKEDYIFKTVLGWARFGDPEAEFKPDRYRPAKRTRVFQADVNFAASFALQGDLNKAFTENVVTVASSGKTISKKKSFPHFLTSYQTPIFINKLRPSLCPGK